MNEFPEKLQRKIMDREQESTIRGLSLSKELIDFSSNDYLGFSFSEEIFQKAHQYLVDTGLRLNGATGSRLLSGNHELHEIVEKQIAVFFNTEAALMFNSGYDANLGLFSAVPQRGDVILYDEFIHASIRDGIRLSNAKAYNFKHNNIAHLKEKLEWTTSKIDSNSDVYIVTESVFSMDGDSPDLKTIAALCKRSNVHLIVDEAHAIGVFGNNGVGLIQKLGLEEEVFARVVTFGKALGCHGAAILGSNKLRTFLVNFSRSFIYTTAIPVHTVAIIKFALEELVLLTERGETQIIKLKDNIQYFNQKLLKNSPQQDFIESNSAIHCCVISGNEKVKKIANQLQKNGLDVKPILSPTVPQGQERLRICLHAYNSKEEIDKVLELLATFVSTL